MSVCVCKLRRISLSHIVLQRLSAHWVALVVSAGSLTFSDLTWRRVEHRVSSGTLYLHATIGNGLIMCHAVLLHWPSLPVTLPAAFPFDHNVNQGTPNSDRAVPDLGPGDLAAVSDGRQAPICPGQHWHPEVDHFCWRAGWPPHCSVNWILNEAMSPLCYLEVLLEKVVHSGSSWWQSGFAAVTCSGESILRILVSYSVLALHQFITQENLMKSTPSQLLVMILIVLTSIIPQPLQPPPSSSSYVVLIIIHPHPGCISRHPSSSTTSTSSRPILGHQSHDIIASSCSIAFPPTLWILDLSCLLACSCAHRLAGWLGLLMLFKCCRRHTQADLSLAVPLQNQCS